MRDAAGCLNGERAWPRTWGERRSGWQGGAIFRLDWATSAAAIDEDTSPEAPLADRPVLGDPALVGRDRSGRLLAFSARAVLEAYEGFQSWGIRTFYHRRWYVSWLNGSRATGTAGYASELAVPGLEVMEGNGIALAFCPEVLGPLGRVVRDGWDTHLLLGPGLQGRTVDRGILLRGAALADGYWRGGLIEPWPAFPEGWCWLPIRIEIREG